MRFKNTTNAFRLYEVTGTHTIALKTVADIYFTEFMRLFNHYYFRWIVKKMQEKGTLDTENPAFLKSTSEEWTGQYKQGKLKRKKVEIFAGMFVEEE